MRAGNTNPIGVSPRPIPTADDTPTPAGIRIMLQWKT